MTDADCNRLSCTLYPSGGSLRWRGVKLHSTYHVRVRLLKMKIFKALWPTGGSAFDAAPNSASIFLEIQPKEVWPGREVTSNGLLLWYARLNGSFRKNGFLLPSIPNLCSRRQKEIKVSLNDDFCNFINKQPNPKLHQKRQLLLGTCVLVCTGSLWY